MSRLYDPGIQPFTVTLDTVTNTSGSYTHATQNSSITATMKPIQIECSNPDAFGDNITITTSAGEITLTCNEVAGTSDVTVTLMQQVAEAFRPLETTSTEFDILAGRIGTLSSLATTEQNTLVGAINEIIRTASTSIVSYGITLYLFRDGNVVNISTHGASQTPNSNVTAGTNMWTIPLGFRPESQQLAIAGHNGWNLIPFVLLTAGAIQPKKDLTANKGFMLSYTYLTTDDFPEEE